MASTIASPPRLRGIDWLFVGASALLLVLPWAMGGGLSSDKTWALKIGALMLAMGPLIALAGLYRYTGCYYLLIGAGFALAPLLMALEGATWAEWTLFAVGACAMVAGAGMLGRRREAG